MGPKDKGRGCAESLPALSMEAPPSEGSHPFAASEAGRYSIQGVLGWGGMGRVSLAEDQRLGREVAVKHNTPGRPNGEQRLAQEAWVTAQLEHPGIVPVYDAGQDPDGRLWYAMRVVRGKTLAEALKGRTLPERLELLRHFLTACEAVGFAHHRGIIHRDLKPQNVMIGEFGETQVVDWGLARGEEQTGGSDPVRTVEGSVVGTPAYMSPEQALGQSVDCRSDVWSLGACLYELLAGRPPFEGSSESVLRQVVAAPFPTLEDPELPPELVAVVERAMEREPDARYPDARALAADIERYTRGVLVRAHAYSSRELLARFVRAQRGVLAVGSSAIVVLLLALGWLAMERQRAVDAEARVEESRAMAAENLAHSLLTQAIQARDVGQQPQAEQLAAEVLRVLPEDPKARGILASYSAQDSPRLLERGPMPTCDRGDVSPDGSYLACHDHAARRLTLYDLASEGPPKERWSKDLALRKVGFSHPDRVVSYDLSGSVWLLDVDDGAAVLGREHYGTTRPVPSGPDEILWQSTLSLELSTKKEDSNVLLQERMGTQLRHSDGTLILIDAQGGISRYSESGPAEVLAQTELVGRHIAQRARSYGDALLIGGLRGRVVLVDLKAGEVRFDVQSPAGDVLDMRLSEDGQRIAVVGLHGGVYVYSVNQGSLVATLPGEQVWGLRFGAQGHTLETFGQEHVRWSLPASNKPELFQARDGITSIDLSAEGDLLAAGTGEGVAVVWDLESGAQVQRWQVGHQVVKAVSFAPRGRGVALARPQPATILLADPQSGEMRVLAPNLLARRMILGEGLVVSTTYNRGPVVVEEGVGVHEELIQLGQMMIDLAASADRDVFVMNDDQGGIWRLDAQSLNIARVAEVDQASRVAVTHGAESRIAVSTQDRVVSILDGHSGAPLMSLPPCESLILDLEFSPDGQLLALGLLDGTVQVWSLPERRLLISLRGHRERVSALRFDDDAAMLYTASWDGTVRQWDVQAMGAPVEELVARTSARWGLELSDLLE